MRECRNLRRDEQVVFLVWDELLERKVPINGNVLFINEPRGTVVVCYLDGYRSETADVRYADMLAVYDPEGAYMKFDNICGNSCLLEGGREFARRAAIRENTFSSERCPLRRNDYLL